MSKSPPPERMEYATGPGIPVPTLATLVRGDTPPGRGRDHEELERLREECQQQARELKELKSSISEDTGILRIDLDEIRSFSKAVREETAALKADMDEMSASYAARTMALERGLADEVEARTELEKGLGKDLTEFVKTEMEQARETVMREMRERMDGQKVLREEVQLQQQALVSFTGRVDEVIIELRTELPRLGQEQATVKADLAGNVERLSAALERVTALERGVAEEGRERKSMVKASEKELRELQERESQVMASQLSELRRQFDELGARTEAADAALGKELNERVATESENMLGQMAELRKAANEQRLRSDVSHNLLNKDLRDHVAAESERLGKAVGDLRRAMDDLGGRADEAQKTMGRDLREHVAVECKDLRERMALEREQLDAQLEELRRQLSDAGSRMDTSQNTLSNDLHEYVATEAERMDTRLSEFQHLLDELGGRAEDVRGEARDAHTRAEQVALDVEESQKTISRLDGKVQAVQDQCSQQATDLEKRMVEMDGAMRSTMDTTIQETKSGLHSWVDATVVNRVNSLDRGLRTEMAERSTAVQQLVGKVSHNAERWCQLQAKFDEVLVCSSFKSARQS